MVEFDKYVEGYKDLVNNGITFTGENIEYFIKIRIALMKNKISKKIGIKELYNKNLRILDYGCGLGITEMYLRKSFPNAEIYGVDVSPKSIVRAEKNVEKLGLKKVSFQLLDSEKLPFKDEYFDIIYSNGTFHHIDHDKHKGIFRELFRVCRKYLFVFENNPFNPLMMRLMRNFPPDQDAKVLYPRYLREIFIASNFKVKATNYYIFMPKFLKFLRFTEKYLQWLPLGAQYFVWGKKV